MVDVSYDRLPKHHRATGKEKPLIGAASLGTVFEWYDHSLHGSMSIEIMLHCVSGVGPALGFIVALAVFAAGFGLRPLGAVVFGRIGDGVGRKNTFLVTLFIMGISSFIVGLMPSCSHIGLAAPIILMLSRLQQDLARGGEYGGVAVDWCAILQCVRLVVRQGWPRAAHYGRLRVGGADRLPVV
jgi:MFS family permease